MLRQVTLGTMALLSILLATAAVNALSRGGLFLTDTSGANMLLDGVGGLLVAS